MHHASLRRVAACLGLLVLLAGCTEITPSRTPAGAPSGGGSPAPAPIVKWPAAPNPMELAIAAGLVPETAERLAFHVHAHLDVFIDGAPVVVPAGIGINITDPGVKTFDDGPGGTKAYGGITGCDQPCISSLHTHDVTGIIHTESATPTPNTLGQLFIEWGVPLSKTCVGEYCTPDKAISIYIAGAAFSGDPTTIQLTDHLEIAIVIGAPPATIPFSADFSQA